MRWSAKKPSKFGCNIPFSSRYLTHSANLTYHLDTEMSSGDIVDSFSSDSSRVSKFSTSRNMLQASYLSNRPSHKLDSLSPANSQFAHLKPDKHHFLCLLVHKSSLNQHQSFHHSQICSSFARMFAVEFNTSPF